MKYTQDLLKKLCESVCAGHICETLEIIKEETACAEQASLFGGNLCVTLAGESQKCILLEAHIDEIAFTVTAVDENGFAKVNCMGGFDIRTLPSHIVTIYGKEPVPAVFTSVPPHIAGTDTVFDSIDKLSLDTGLGKRAAEIIAPGDIAAYKKEAKMLGAHRFCGKSLDNRAGCAILLSVFRELCGKKLPVTVKFLFSNTEEIGSRGAQTSIFATECDEAIAVDASFAAAPTISPEQCGRFAKGGMIGISPILSKKVTEKLISVAKDRGIPCQKEVMGKTTSTDADMISVSKSGIPTGLVSFPLRNMHTDAEIVDIRDIDSITRLLCEYVLAGGAL